MIFIDLQLNVDFVVLCKIGIFPYDKDCYFYYYRSESLEVRGRLCLSGTFLSLAVYMPPNLGFGFTRVVVTLEPITARGYLTQPRSLPSGNRGIRRRQRSGPPLQEHSVRTRRLRVSLDDTRQPRLSADQRRLGHVEREVHGPPYNTHSSWRKTKKKTINITSVRPG